MMRALFIAMLSIAAARPASADLSAAPSVFVREIRLDDNSLIPAPVLEAALQPYVNRTLTAAELQTIARQLTSHLIEAGYVSSGVVLPDQKVENGVLHFRLVPGRITSAVVQGKRRLRDEYVLARLGDAGTEPLNVKSLAERLQLLQQDPRVERVDASIKPGLERGTAVLHLEIDEKPAYGFSVGTDNHVSPNVGEQQFTAELHHLNLFGFGDSVQLSYSYAEGLEAGSAAIAVPISARDTTLGAFVEANRSQIVSEPFAALDIEGEATRYGIEVRHPLLRTLQTHLTIGLGIEAQDVRSYLLGEPFSFATADGASKTTVVSFSQEWVRRAASRVLALRSTFHAGIDALGATIGGEADGEFLYWLGQAQWVEKLAYRDSTVALRIQGRVANDALPSYRKYALGGAQSVRGYRENLFVRDHGGLASIEWSVPLARWTFPGLSRDASDGELLVTPFADYGVGRDDDEASEAIDIASVGIAIEWRIGANSRIELQLAKALIDRASPGVEEALQDEGVHFSARIGW